MDVINGRIEVTHMLDEETPIDQQAETVVNDIIQEQRLKIVELGEQIVDLKSRAVHKRKKTAYILVVEQIECENKMITIRIRRLNKQHVGAMQIYDYRQSLLFIDNLPIAMTINEEIKESITSNIQDVKVKGTKYTFLENQLDDVKRIINEVVDKRDDV
ncbi:MAG: hypothetical protein EZS28_037080 [Streblomastix strix]|uniref:Uncharacterized protein n=1 Tax=Streblomastix strix TaxID=222440 RepID=A0A5J4UB08_9EUKA|nr:MAG: hypothetical protein EZS28_037080 [Streblomastix strix]